MTRPLGISLWFPQARICVEYIMTDKSTGRSILNNGQASFKSLLLRGALGWTRYFSGITVITPPLVLQMGTPFQRKVWDALREIPSGTTLSYSALAAKVNRPGAVRAIGGAVGRNPISILIPCHRVVGIGGKITGYAGGIAKKQWLLNHEKRALC